MNPISFEPTEEMLDLKKKKKKVWLQFPIIHDHVVKV